MKKITLLLLFFCSFLGYGQLETFEGGIPATWKVMTGTNGLGAAEVWKLNTTPPASPYLGYGGTGNAAYVNNVNVGQNNTEEDWLIMNQRTVPANGQLRFFVRQTQAGNQFTKFEIRISTNAVQDDQGQYQVLQSFTEGQLNNLNGDITQYEEKVIDLDDYIGQTVYVAFVRVHPQTGPGRAGERFLVDNVNILSQCNAPTGLDAPIATVNSTTAVLTWLFPAGATSFEIEILNGNNDPVGAGVNVPPPPFTAGLGTGPALLPETTYKYFVRTRCVDPQGGFYTSGWAGPFFFTTLPLGSVCADPLKITALPYQVTGANTGFYGDQYDALQGTQCGAVPATTNYLQGSEVFYTYTPTQSGNISLIMTPLGAASTNSSIFVYTGSCTSVTTSCVAGMANTGTTPRTLNVAVTADTTYYIVISSSTTPSINYNLLIQQENCLPKPTNLSASNQTLVGTNAGVTLGWDNPGGYTSFQVEVQPLNSPIPSGPGAYNFAATGATIAVPITGLNPATIYQYWVRAECTFGSGVYTSWAGPFVFNTLVCEPANACNYIFKLNDTGSNGWGTNRMQVRQNGIVVATLGEQIATGAGPIDVLVPMCPGVPFDLFWSATGANPAQCGVTVINSFGQTLYTKPTNLNAPNTILFTDVVKCDAPRCDLIPTNLAAPVILTDGATLSWSSMPITAFEIYFVPTFGATAPTASTIPTYTGNSPDNTFVIPDPLEADLSYSFWVRTPCSPNASVWAGPFTFMTLPTCYKPATLTVVPGSITLHNATFDWTNGIQTGLSWEILLIPGQNTPPPPPVNPVLTGGTLLFTTTVDAPFTPPGDPLTNATIYHYYIRSVCAGDDKSRWTGPLKFNTLTCNAADKCDYKFVLTNTSGNSWNGGRMEVRQNGILITTIGATGINNANGIAVGLCHNIPFELFWSVAGTAPQNIGVSIQNPFLDVLFTKAAGTGSPLSQVYQGITNCTPAACSKPTNMMATNITSNSAELVWTDNSTPPSVSYDIYVVLTGGPAPINEPPTPATVSGVQSGYVLTTLNSLPLLPSTSYTFYVKANCTGSETSSWTVLSPTMFVTNPENNECSAAKVVVVNSGQSCVTANTVRGTTYGATGSLPAGGTTAGCGVTSDDVWYSFVATHTAHMINFSNIVSTPTTIRINHSVFSGTCNAFVQMYCSTLNNSLATGLTVGETYFVRVYTSGTNTTAQFAQFDLCITSPPVNNECAAALPVTVNTGQTCTTESLVHGNTFGASQSLPAAPTTPATCGTTDDDIWYSFVASHTSQTINFTNIVITPATNRINHTLLSGTCDNLTVVYCSNATSSVATGLVVGSTYYVRVYTQGSVVSQSAEFDICITSPPANDECVNAYDVPVNPLWECNPSLNVSGNTLGASPSVPTLTGTGCTTSDDDVWFKFTATSAIHTINLSSIVGSTTGITLNHTLFSGACDALVNLYCSTQTESVAIGLTPGNVYYVRVYTAASTPGQSATFKICVSTPPPPAGNDECSTVISLDVNVRSECLVVKEGNIIGATPSTGVANTCLGTEDDDVWFNFVATSNQMVISLLNVRGTTTNLNHTVYSGTCGSLVQRYCSAANSLSSTATNFVVGQTYWIRVYSNQAVSQVVVFDICVKPVSTCQNAAPFCGSSSQDPFIFPNTVGIVPGAGPIACLDTTPNPTYYTLRVDSTGPLFFNILQNSSFDADGNPNGNTLDVDFVAWGPFSDEQSCNQISFTDCPSCPFSNVGSTFYPLGNIVDCSYSASFTETLSIPNAQAGQIYIILITNYSGTAGGGLGNPGFIRLVQTNFDAPNSGKTVCCDVNLGNNKSACATSITLNALEDVIDLNNVPAEGTYKWYFNNSTTPIPGAINSTYVATESGIYKVIGKCGLNEVNDEIIVTLSPPIVATTPDDYVICDDVLNDGSAPFNLADLNSQLQLADLTLYDITYHLTPLAAENDATGISPTGDFTTQTIYIRIESLTLSTCFLVVPVNLVVSVRPNAEFNFDPLYCQNATTNPSPAFGPTGVAGLFEATPAGLVFVNTATGEIDLVNSLPNTYTITNTILGTPANKCPDVPFTDTVTIIAKPVFTLTGIKDICPDEQTTIQVVVTDNSFDLTTATYQWFRNTIALTAETGSSLLIDGDDDYGNYIVIVTNQICSAEQNFSINNSNTNWGVSIVSSDNELCGSETAVLTVNLANNPSALPVTSYTFTLPDNSTVTSTTNTLSINAIGTYSVTVNILGCESSNSITILEGIADWQVTFNGPYVICPNQPVNLSFTPVNFNLADAIFTWERPDGSTFVGTALNGVTQIGVYTLEININGCKVERSVTVTQNTEVIPVNLEYGCEGQKFIIRAVPVNGSFDPATSSYDWSGSGYTQTADNEVVVTSKGIVTVKVTPIGGCEGTATLDTTTINLGCIIQRGISPNNDGDNDFFDLSGYDVKHLGIFNRYGTEVYQRSNYVKEWNGQSNSGDQLTDGTYFYVIDLVGGGTKTGWIYLNR